MGPRLAAGVALVLLTYNPSGRSFVHWLVGHDPGERSVLALAGVALLILWVVLLRATVTAIGVLGALLTGALVAALLWVLSDYGVLALDSGSALQWAALVALGLVLGVGLSWAQVRQRLSGQATVDDGDGR
jgi:hypothetical protein